MEIVFDVCKIFDQIMVTEHHLMQHAYTSPVINIGLTYKRGPRGYVNTFNMLINVCLLRKCHPMESDQFACVVSIYAR